MRISLLLFVIGCASLGLFGELPSYGWLWLNLLLPMALFQRWLRPFTAFVAGFSWAFLHASNTLEKAFPPSLEGRDLTVEGHVVSVPVRRGRMGRFVFRIERILEPAGTAWHGDVRLGWPRKGQIPAAGEKWRLIVRLRVPHGYRNPGGFDLEAWMIRHKIRATGYVRNRTAIRLPGHHWNIHVLRQWLGDRINRWTAGSRHAGLFQALAIGVREKIGPIAWEILRATGTNHLVAISGLHIGIVAGLMFGLWSWFWRRWSWLTDRCATPRSAALAAIVAAFIYAALAGFSIPTVRALVMLSVIMLSVWQQRISLPSRVLAIALFVVVLIDPFAPMAPGFWLSFLAVAVILYGVTGRIGRRRKWREAIRIQWIIALGLFPVGMFIFGQISIIAPVANILAVPWVSLLIVPLVLVGSLLGSFIDAAGILLFGLADTLMQPLWFFLEFMAKLPLASWQAPAPGLMTVIVACLGAFLLVAPRGFPARSAGLVMLLPVFLVSHDKPHEGGYRVDVLDVGQGLAVVVQTARHVLLYDTGPSFGRHFDAAKAVILPFFRQRGIHQIDLLIVSHADRDHRGGMHSLLRGIQVNRVISGMPGVLGTPAGICRSGQSWTWDGVRFRILHPETSQGYGRNDRSCVLHIASAGGGGVLLTGDIERRAESRLVRDGVLPRSDILLVPHHGSRTSSSNIFIDAVRPRLAIVTTGYRNRFGHPVVEVRNRYLARGILWLDTSDSGAISFTIPPLGGPVVVRRFRPENNAWWHHRSLPVGAPSGPKIGYHGFPAASPGDGSGP